MNLLNILLQSQAGKSSELELLYIILAIVIILYIFFLHPKKERKNDLQKTNQNKKISFKEDSISDTCPHCKSPIEDTDSVCEWCGCSLSRKGKERERKYI